MKQFKNINKLVDMFIESNELGLYSLETYRILLTDIPNKPDVIEGIKKRIDTVTKKYKLSYEKNKNPYINVHILDIDL